MGEVVRLASRNGRTASSSVTEIRGIAVQHPANERRERFPGPDVVAEVSCYPEPRRRARTEPARERVQRAG